MTAFLRSRFGRVQLAQATYGSVVQHIEPEHLTRVLIPDISSSQRDAIGLAVIHAYELRDEANLLFEEADRLLHERLNLPALDSLVLLHDGPKSAVIMASRLASRFEASFHDPVAMAAEQLIRSFVIQGASLEDKRVSREIRPITKFRKRVYVQKGGIPLLSSKQIFQIDPIDVKCLAKGAHTKDLPEIALEENMICVSCSGTIGRVQVIPRYMSGWAANQHATRVIAAETMNPGYVYAWLASDYGTILIKRLSYGSVILEIDKEMLGSVPVPLPDRAAMNDIGNLVLKGNALRNEAWQIERGAIVQIEELVAIPSQANAASLYETRKDLPLAAETEESYSRKPIQGK